MLKNLKKYEQEGTKSLLKQIHALLPFGMIANPLAYVKKVYWLAFIRASSDYTIAILKLYE